MILGGHTGSRAYTARFLVVDGLRGWYRALHELEGRAVDADRIEVFTRSWGRLGSFTSSPATGLWHATSEEIHLAGNPTAH